VISPADPPDRMCGRPGQRRRHAPYRARRRRQSL